MVFRYILRASGCLTQGLGVYFRTFEIVHLARLRLFYTALGWWCARTSEVAFSAFSGFYNLYTMFHGLVSLENCRGRYVGGSQPGQPRD